MRSGGPLRACALGDSAAFRQQPTPAHAARRQSGRQLRRGKAQHAVSLITVQPATSARCVQPCPTFAATPSAAVSLRLRRPLPAFRSTPPALRPIVARRQAVGHEATVRVLRRSPDYRPALYSGPVVTASPRASANPSRSGTTAAPCRPASHPWPERPASLPGCRPVPLQRCARSRPTPALRRCGVRFQSGPGG